MMCWGSGVALSGFQLLGEPTPLPKMPAAMSGGLQRDPSDELSSFGLSHKRGSLPLPSLAPLTNPIPLLPPVGSH